MLCLHGWQHLAASSGVIAPSLTKYGSQCAAFTVVLLTIWPAEGPALLSADRRCAAADICKQGGPGTQRSNTTTAGTCTTSAKPRFPVESACSHMLVPVLLRSQTLKLIPYALPLQYGHHH